MQLEIKDEYVKSESIYLISNFDVNKLNDLTKYILNKISNLPNEYRIYRNKDFYYD